MYAKDTSVSVERSKAEIESTTMRYGATGFVSGWMHNIAMISFEMKDRRVKFTLPLPAQNSAKFTEYKQGRSTFIREPQAARKLWEQACRQKWRALALAVKAKLEAVESGIATFEEEFLSYVVTADGLTIGEKLIPELESACTTGRMPALLPAPNASKSTPA